MKWIVLGLLLAMPSIRAMDFYVEQVGGEPAIFATGIIEMDDARKLMPLMRTENRHSEGYYAMVLSSDGGSVAGALEISDLMGTDFFNTYVLDKCASACASVIFLAGKEHIVAPSGLLGFHGCYNAQNFEIVAQCNEKMAVHIVHNGNAYGALMAFIRDVPAHEMLWLDKEQADCYAINRYVITPKPEGYERCVFEIIRQSLPQ